MGSMGRAGGRAAAMSLSVLSVVSLAVGCTDGHKAVPRAAAPPKASAAVTETPSSGSVTELPPLGGEDVVAQAANVTGSRELDIKGDIGSGALSVDVECEGKGRLTVAVRAVGLSFPLACVDGEVTSTYNVADLKRDPTRGTVSVTASAGVRWAIAVGHQDASGRSDS
ncbi:hypothetical protein AB0M32_12650 [Streptomyces sp. NPDC051985]|uniref:hypothetical protein n=1 Tax=Streptomyces sp. NPDC051985 TaxID=3155807 RepID=UPI00341954E7